MTTKIPPCSICRKKTKEECSHVRCPNRKPITAQVAQSEDMMPLASGCFVRQPKREK